jgi:hypothetical protein
MLKLLRVLRPGYPLDRVVSDNEPCGTILRNFDVEKETLSFFAVTDDTPEEEIAFQVARSRKAFDDVDYCVVDGEELGPQGVNFEPTPGSTGNARIDAAHFDAVRMSVARTATLAMHCVSRGEKRTISGKEVGLRVVDALDSGQIDPASLHSSLVANVEAFKKSSHYKDAMKKRRMGTAS